VGAIVTVRRPGRLDRPSKTRFLLRHHGLVTQGFADLGLLEVDRFESRLVEMTVGAQLPVHPDTLILQRTQELKSHPSYPPKCLLGLQVVSLVPQHLSLVRPILSPKHAVESHGSWEANEFPPRRR
jgi:hypothetical protein